MKLPTQSEPVFRAAHRHASHPGGLIPSKAKQRGVQFKCSANADGVVKMRSQGSGGAGITILDDALGLEFPCTAQGGDDWGGLLQHCGDLAELV